MGLLHRLIERDEVRVKVEGQLDVDGVVHRESGLLRQLDRVAQDGIDQLDRDVIEQILPCPERRPLFGMGLQLLATDAGDFKWQELRGGERVGSDGGNDGLGIRF
ncbi:MAG: hypothetical protein ACOYXR_03310 [Nitrospirota bacterium]